MLNWNQKKIDHFETMELENIVFRLRASDSVLVNLENNLDAERAALINHDANDSNSYIDNAMHFDYESMVKSIWISQLIILKN